MYEVTMPKLSDSMEVGRIIAWRVREGDWVREGDILAEVESDKATMELECFKRGVLHKIARPAGSEVPVGEVIALIGAKGEAAGTAVAGRKEADAEPKAADAPVPAPETAERQGQAQPATRPAASPYARRVAAERGVDLAGVKGSGPAGRIVAKDVEAAAKTKDGGTRPSVGEPTPAAPVTATAPAVPAASVTPVAPAASPRAVEPRARVVAEKRGIDTSRIAGTGVGGRVTVADVTASGAPQPGLKPSADEELPVLDVTPDEADITDAPFRLRTQARRVTASKHVIPHFYLTRSIDMTALVAQRERLKSELNATLTHVIMLAVVRALGLHPEANRSYDHGRIIAWKGVNLGLAVDTPEGLTVAVIPHAQKLDLKGIVDAARALVDRARAGKLAVEDRRHPTFTISNLGMFDVEQFEAIINPPSAMTLAVASILPAPVVRGDKVEVGQVMSLTLSCDHRIIDGVAAAKFMKDLKGLLENAGSLAGEG